MATARGKVIIMTTDGGVHTATAAESKKYFSLKINLPLVSQCERYKVGHHLPNRYGSNHRKTPDYIKGANS